MTLRNRHDRTSDHDETLDAADVEVGGTSLYDVLTALIAGLGGSPPSASKLFTLNAVVKRTITWQYIDGSIRMDAIIGTPSALTFPGKFTLASAKRQVRSGSFTAAAIRRGTQPGSFTIDAVVA